MTSSKSKKERRLKRHIRNKEKDETHKKEVWETGGIIEENHNNKPYSPEFTRELSNRILGRLDKYIESGNLLLGLYRYKKMMQTLILLWSPEVDEDENYERIKTLLEDYWDGKYK